MTRRLFPAILAGLALMSSLSAQNDPPATLPAGTPEIDLWPGELPGAPLSAEAERSVAKPGDPIARITHVQKPSLQVFLPPKEKANGAAVVIYPGGGYGILAIDHEGWQVARRLNEMGIAGIVCKYRVTSLPDQSYRHPVPLLDARQAVRITRQHAAEWNLDPKKIGVLGFSAGGHLASTVTTLFAKKLDGEDEAIFATQVHKPDFSVLVYPVISFTQEFGHSGSKKNLLGPNPDVALEQLLSAELQVTKDTPPTFLVSTWEDKAVPPLNAMAFYQAMFRFGIPGELHVWEKGPHGFGILPDRGDVATEWPARLEKWLKERGTIPR